MKQLFSNSLIISPENVRVHRWRRRDSCAAGAGTDIIAAMKRKTAGQNIRNSDDSAPVSDGGQIMREELSRTALLLGEEGVERLRRARVAVFGIGGVGGYVAEALARSGVGALELIDSDRVCLSNLNRQIIALHSTVGRYKTEVMRERILDINPEAEVTERRCFFLPENAAEFDFASYDYVVDAVDTVTAKIALVLAAQRAGVPIICSMGAGNKLDPSRFRVADLYETRVCPLAKVMRREMKKRGVERLKVVYSEEEPRRPAGEGNGRTPGSTAFAPPAAGLLIASEVVRDLLKS